MKTLPLNRHAIISGNLATRAGRLKCELTNGAAFLSLDVPLPSGHGVPGVYLHLHYLNYNIDSDINESSLAIKGTVICSEITVSSLLPSLRSLLWILPKRCGLVGNVRMGLRECFLVLNTAEHARTKKCIHFVIHYRPYVFSRLVFLHVAWLRSNAVVSHSQRILMKLKRTVSVVLECHQIRCAFEFGEGKVRFWICSFLKGIIKSSWLWRLRRGSV